MIQADNQLFALHTNNTTYAFMVDEVGNLINLHYGERISIEDQVVEALRQKASNQNGCSIIADTALPNQCLDDVCLELSTRGAGDMREPLVELVYEDGSRTCDFRYENYFVEKKRQLIGMPSAYDEQEQAESLTIVMKEKNHNVRLELVYSVFEECDCITRYAVLRNDGEEPVKVLRLMSSQLDLPIAEAKVTSFHGDWTREMGRYDTVLQAGKYVSDSVTGYSSNKSNPFIMLADVETAEDYGNCYASNLIYSGNHRECVEMGGHGKLRFLTGIHPDTFEWHLEGGDVLEAPEAVLTYSNKGYQGISTQMHAFVREHIVRGEWKRKTRPILLNSWEAAYFNFKESNLCKLAKTAKVVGVELFVLDDGWFGKRNSDASSLGDWYDNVEKLPQGLAGLSTKIREMGLDFGIWVEPEMISEDSDLYRAHPEWAVRIPGQQHACGRNQMVLDFTKKEVQDYIIEAMSDIFTRGKVSYVKWDMNRHMSDYYSQGMEADRQGEFAHRYILGLYRVLYHLVKRFPQVLFEGCASGGNRFDLGILCYMPQIWASDNTDAVSRGVIQNGYSYGYPQSVMSAHVSGCPNHQTLRVTPLSTRFAIACGGILGYECNLSDMKKEELNEIAEQISLYKQWRETLQFGQLYRLKPARGINTLGRRGPYDTDVVRWNIVGKDATQAVGIVLQGQVIPNYSHHTFQTKGLDNDKLYHFYNIPVKYDIHRMGDLVNTISPIHIKQDSLVHDVVAKFVKLDGEVEDMTVSGSLLNHSGVRLAQSFAGTGFGTNTSLYQDYDAKMYFMEAVSHT